MQLKIEQARVIFRNGGCSRQRAENISRLTFEYVHRMAAGQRSSNEQRLEPIAVTPLRLDLETLSDRQVARAAAHAVLRTVAAAGRIKAGS